MDAAPVCLIYEAHNSSMVEALGDLFRSSSLVDCVLAAEGQCLKAHKVVLAVSSPYFQMLFNQENDKFPIVFLKDIEYQYLKLVIDYIYHGQIEIKSSQLDMFLGVARSLKIRGLDATRRENISEERKFSNPPYENPSVEKADTSLSVLVQEVKVEKEGISDCKYKEDITEMENSVEDLDFSSQRTEYCSEIIEEPATSVAPSQCHLIPSANSGPEIGARDTESQQSPLSIRGVSSAIDNSARVQMENYSEIFEAASIKIEETISGENFMEDEDDPLETVTRSYCSFERSSNADS